MTTIPTYSYTSHYSLGELLKEKMFSATQDKARFSTIDTQLSFITNLIGDGVIDGWSVSDTSSGGKIEITVGDGYGIISGIASRSFGDLSITIPDDSTSYVFICKESNSPRTFGGFSDISYYIYSDSVPPATPTGLAASDITSSSIKLTWDANSELDFYQYILYRSVDDITYTEIDRTQDLLYTDENLASNVLYYYKISAIDTSGNESTLSSSVFAATLIDYSYPPSPNYFIYLASDSKIQLIWSIDDTTNVKNFIVNIQPVDSEYVPIGAMDSYILDNDIYDIIIDNLINNQNYYVEIYTVSHSDVSSEKISLFATPKYNNGPGEVENIISSYSQSVDNLISISLDISWTPSTDPYKNTANKYIVTIIENGKNVSDSVEFYDTSISIETISYSGVCSPILPNIEYIIKIQAVDSSGNINHGVITRVKTGQVINPEPVSSVEHTLETDNLIFYWNNSQSSFEYNSISITDKDLDIGTITTIVSNQNIYSSNSYSLNRSYIYPNHEYTIEIYVYDSFGNSSSSRSYSYISPVLDYTTDAVPAVESLFAFSGDNEVFIIWEPVNADYTQYYHIWKADFRGLSTYTYNDFSLLDTVPSSVTSYHDRVVTNGGRYIYFITTTDTFGNKSKNPIDDHYYSYSTASTTAIANIIEFDIPVISSITNPSGLDLLVSWTAQTNSFDGYEIWRSIGNKYSWEKVGYTSKAGSSFLDKNALENGSNTYYYIIRQYRNEVSLTISSSPSISNDCILLCDITTVSGVITEINRTIRDVSGLKDYTEEKLYNIASGHKHNLSNITDNRIDLSENIIIYNWTSSDNKTFTTTDSMITFILVNGVVDSTIMASDYVVKIDGVLTNINYSVDPYKKILKFDEEISTYTEISVECIGLSETDGILPEEAIMELSGTQLNDGKVNKNLIPEIYHEGRIKEELIPLQYPMMTSDGYTFSIFQNSNSDYIQTIGESYTFYDVIEPSSGTLVAATSNGLMISKNAGITWANFYTTIGSVHKIYYASTLQKYVALSSKSAYISDDGISWIKISGLNNVSVIRDAVEDGTNVYITTNIGVFILIEDTFGHLTTCRNLYIFSGQTTDTYAIWYDDYNSRIVISTEIGLFETYNQGITWSFITDIDSFDIVWKFEISGNYIFALTERGIYRKYYTDITFARIASFDFGQVRNFVIFDNKIIIATKNGVKESGTENIYTSYTIDMITPEHTFEFSSKISPMTMIKVIGDYIYFGSDKHLFIGTTLKNVDNLYTQNNGICPSVYVDYEEQSIGYFYDIGSSTLYFDHKIDDNSLVSVASQYDIFRLKDGGWVDQKYDATVNIYSQNGLYASVYRTDSPVESFSSVVFDVFDESNSNSRMAEEYRTQYIDTVVELAEAVGINPPTDARDPQVISSDIVHLYQKTYSQYTGNIKYASLKTINNIEYFIVDYIIVPSSMASAYFTDVSLIENIPEVVVSSDNTTNITGDASNGVISFTNTLFNKYDPLYAYILGTSLTNAGENTHRQIEDELSLFDSGLPYSLSEVFQTNINKCGLYLDRRDSSAQTIEDLAAPYNSEYITPRNSDWYDVINSTIDYNLETECSESGIDAQYVLSVLYIPEIDYVLAATDDGAIYIDVTNLNMSSLYISDLNDGEYFRDLYRYNNTIYALTNQNIYYSDDYTSSWTKIENYGLPNGLNKIRKIDNKLVVATINGIYYKFDFGDTWIQAMSSDNVRLLFINNGIFSIVNNNIYYSNNGINWILKSDSGNIFINRVDFMNSMAIMATNYGLRHDGGTIYGTQLGLTAIDLENNLSNSSQLKINDVNISSDKTKYVAGANNGVYYLWDSSDSSILRKNDSFLNTIHKVLYVEDSYWLFGNGYLKTSDFPLPVKISTGIPF